MYNILPPLQHLREYYIDELGHANDDDMYETYNIADIDVLITIKSNLIPDGGTFYLSGKIPTDCDINDIINDIRECFDTNDISETFTFNNDDISFIFSHSNDFVKFHLRTGEQ